MLRETFLHLSGVGEFTERTLWQRGCDNWDVLQQNFESFSLGSASRNLARRELEQSQEALSEGIHQFFSPKLRQKSAWRAFPEFRSSCVYLDIETDGGPFEDSITMIGLYDGSEYQCLIRGESLESFRDVISRYSMIVTFFGGGFDLPVLQRRFPDVLLDHIHLDLCPALRRVGYRGGLKKIEAEFGITRSEKTQGLNGYDAVRLWRAAQRGSDEALDILIQYNKEDVVNLEPLAEHAYRLLTAQARTGPARQPGRRKQP